MTVVYLSGETGLKSISLPILVLINYIHRFMPQGIDLVLTEKKCLGVLLPGHLTVI